MNISNDKSINNRNLIFLIGSLIMLIAGITIFGIHVLWMAITAVVISVIIELIFAKVRGYKLTVGVFVTPIILTLILPPTLPLYMVGVGAFFATFFAKSLFGGDGKYIFNPAVAGVLFLIITFPAFLNTMWLNPVTGDVSSATPLGSLASGNLSLSFSELLMGNTAGYVGETFRLGIIVIGVIFMLLKTIDWKITVSYLGGFLLFTLFFNLVAPDSARDAFYSLFVGNVLFASVFLATDPITATRSKYGVYLYGAGLGLITVVIRHFAAFPEGTIFAIIIMNAVAPLIDSMFEKEVTADE
jgi:Na+-transporting NADH:ubiquinone oxidoreductase subunit B/electron transport complex protein RnfD